MRSGLVGGMSDTIFNRLSGLLEDEQGETWDNVWAILPQNTHNEVREFCVALVGLAAPAWHRRFVDGVTAIPLLLLRPLEEDPNASSSRRQTIAQMFLDACPHCLERPHDDFSLKVRELCYEDFDSMQRSGRVTTLLCAMLTQVVSRSSLARAATPASATRPRLAPPPTSAVAQTIGMCT